MDKTEKYFLLKYGQVAQKLRRGFYNLDEANLVWDEIQKTKLALYKVFELDPETKTVFEAGLD